MAKFLIRAIDVGNDDRLRRGDLVGPTMPDSHVWQAGDRRAFTSGELGEGRLFLHVEISIPGLAPSEINDLNLPPDHPKNAAGGPAPSVLAVDEAMILQAQPGFADILLSAGTLTLTLDQWHMLSPALYWRVL